MGQELALPDWAKNRPAMAFANLNPADDNLSDGIGQSYPVISYKGKVWGMRHRGERKNFLRPDDGTPSAYLDVIILGQAKQKSKSFYKAYDANSEGERPLCSSIDGVTPDPDVVQKQCDTCILCPKNEWKVNPTTGKKGRDCSDYKRLAVLVLPTQTKPMFGEPVLEPAFLRVPAGSLNSLSIMGDTMSGQGYHYASYITRITFDPNESHPKMIFKPQQGLTDAEAPVVLQMRADMTVERIINGGYADGIRTIPPQENTTLLPPPQGGATGLTLENGPQPQPNGHSTGAQSQPAQSPTSSPTPATASAVSASAQPATPATPPPAQVASTGLEGLAGPIPTGLGIVVPASAQQATTPVAQTVGDAGAPEASDDDLDASIAKMLGTAKPN